MNLKKYSELAKRTCPQLGNAFADTVHMLFGISTEIGELQDQYKKHLAYGKELDLVNIEEEIGDIMWYIINFCRFNNLDLEKILDQNIEKLKSRFPDKFTEQLAKNRDLDSERKVLEGYSQMALINEPE